MTDTYSADDNVIDWWSNQRKKTVSDVMSDIDGNPDNAAMALKLQKATGVPAPIINMDVDEYAAKVRKAAAAHIVNQNEVIRQWVDENPMASKIFSDDWHNVDEADEQVRHLHSNIFGLPKALAAGLSAFGEHFDTSGLAKWADPIKDMAP